MSGGKHTFKHTDAARLIRATKAAGLKVKGVTLKDGIVRLEVDGEAAATGAKNPLDRVLKNAQDQKRPA
jgi:hypothetical protein